MADDKELSQHELDGVSGGTDSEQGMQSQMDRMSKLYEALSNIMNGIRSSANKIAQDLK